MRPHDAPAQRARTTRPLHVETGMPLAALALACLPLQLKCSAARVDTTFNMHLQISKWGNSLALRIPSSVVRELGLQNGDTVRARVTADGALAIREAAWSRAAWSRAAFAAELERARAMLPMGASVVDEMRPAARY